MSARRQSSEDVEERLGCRLPQRSTDGAARMAGLTADTWSERTATSLVAYNSEGRVAVIGAEQAAGAAAERIAERAGNALTCTLLVPKARDTAADGGDESGASAVRTIRAELAGVEGYLGQFTIRGRVEGEQVDIAPSLLTAHKPFDIVLDLGEQAQVTSEMLPPGYYAPGDDAEALEGALEEITELVGEFEKPRYFQYDTDICAHGASGITGCTRCIDACPTDAITSIGERIEVNTHLCQGGGSCTAACPTGAITYAFPRVSDLLTSLRLVLATYREAGGASPRLLLYDGDRGRAWLGRNAEGLPENVIPYELEEIGSVGMDTWLAVLAYGAAGTAMLCLPGTPASVRRELEAQRRFADAIVQGMGYDCPAVHILEGDDEALMKAIAALPDGPPITPAGFQAQDEKRTTIRLAVEHLFEQIDHAPVSEPLPEGAPFGELVVNADTCTLCMACTSVCPAAALKAGGEEPKLFFIEWNCVQCGICEAACPEDAITRRPRFVYDPALRRDTRLLNEDQPFHCVGCGKAFATRSVIERMHSKLAEHWMFQKPEAVRRLEMCEDCRVRDMFKDGGGLLDPHEPTS
jgi:ferredoxin